MADFSKNIVIRPYRTLDRAEVRKLCYLTGNKGESAASFFPDEELFSNLWTLYYTDEEPESTWVAELDGKVMGYLNACFSQQKYHQKLFLKVLPISIWNSILRGSIFKLELWKILLASLWQHFVAAKVEFLPLPKIESHMHINLDSKARGLKIGTKLMQIMISKAQELGIKNISADVRSDNEPAKTFFKQHGFKAILEHPGFYLPGTAQPVIRGVLFVLTLSEAPGKTH